MNIAINGYEAVVPRFGYDKSTHLPIRVGSGAYCFELLKSFSKTDNKNNYTIYLPQDPTEDMPKTSSNWKYKIIPARKLWTIMALSPQFLFKKGKPDVFFTPTHYLPPFAPNNSVISILDVSYIYFPDLFNKKDLIQLKKWTKYSVKKAKKIITISNSSKNDIIKEYGVDPKKVHVTYPGIRIKVSSKLQNMDEIKKKFGIEKDYILFVGTLQPRKNIVKLIEAFSRLDENLQLVIVGKKGWKYEEILAAPQDFGVKDKIVFIHNAGDEDLPPLYKNACLFVLPSLYEGFGLPILEAMQYGCPVATSNISSLPEAGGDAAIYFDPENAEDIKEKIEKILSSSDLRQDLIKKGKIQVKKFSWEQTARETLKVLEGLKNE